MKASFRCRKFKGAGAIIALALFLFPAFSSNADASSSQGTTDTSYQQLMEEILISENFQDTSVQLSCGLRKDFYGDLDRESLQSIRAELKASLDAVRAEARKISRSGSKVERAIVRHQEKVLESWLKSARPQTDLQHAMTNLCASAQGAITPVAREGALLAEAAVLTTSLPLRLVSQFLKGAITGKSASEAGVKTKSLYDRLGPSRRIGRHTVLSLSTAALHAGVTGAVLLPGISATLAADFVISYRCQFAPEDSDPGLKSFCSEWEGMKTRFARTAALGRDAGAWFHDAVDRKLVFRSDSRPSRALCRSSWPHQIRVARRVYQRHRQRFQRVTPVEPLILPPGEARDCVKIGLTLSTAEAAARARRALGDVLDGISIEIKVQNSTSTSDAGATPAVASGPAETCTWISTLQKQADGRTKLEERVLGLRSILDAQGALSNPKLHGMPRSSRYEVPGSLVHQAPGPMVTRNRNIILALGPSETEYQRFRSDRALMDVARKAQTRYDSFGKTMKKLLRTKDRPECERLVVDSGFSQEAWNQSVRELDRHTIARQVYEFDHLKRYLEKSLSRTRLRWEVRHTNHLRDLQEVIRAPDVANVLIIAHGLDSGHLRDSGFNEIPSNFFSKVSPSLQSLGFYNCHSEKLTSIYDLEKTLTLSASYHPARLLFSAQESELYRKSGVAPLESIGFFLEQVDHRVAKAAWESERFQKQAGHTLPAVPSVKSTDCRIEARSGSLGEGSYGVSAGKTFLGLMDPGSSRIEFDCEALGEGARSGKTLITVKNLLTREEKPILTPDLILQITRAGSAGVGERIGLTPFYRNDWKALYNLSLPAGL